MADVEQANVQADLLFENGADGLFLISHRAQDELVVELARTFSFKYPSEFKIGINLLQSSPTYGLEMAKESGANMVWCDNVGVSSSYIAASARELSYLSRESGIPVFAGVSFKYQPIEGDPRSAVRNTLDLGFIPTTSGVATGVGPDLEKS